MRLKGFILRNKEVISEIGTNCEFGKATGIISYAKRTICETQKIRAALRAGLKHSRAIKHLKNGLDSFVILSMGHSNWNSKILCSSKLSIIPEKSLQVLSNGTWERPLIALREPPSRSPGSIALSLSLQPSHLTSSFDKSTYKQQRTIKSICSS